MRSRVIRSLVAGGTALRVTLRTGGRTGPVRFSPSKAAALPPASRNSDRNASHAGGSRKSLISRNSIMSAANVEARQLGGADGGPGNQSKLTSVAEHPSPRGEE